LKFAFLQLSLLEYEDDGTLDQTSIIPMVDGGTEGTKTQRSIWSFSSAHCSFFCLPWICQIYHNHKMIALGGMTEPFMGYNIIPFVLSDWLYYFAHLYNYFCRLQRQCSSYYSRFNSLCGVYAWSLPTPSKNSIEISLTVLMDC